MTSFNYIVVSKIDGKTYVGKGNKPFIRMKSHFRHSCNKHLQRSIQKFGVENFEFSVIEEHETEKLAYEAETFWISYFRSIGVSLYNMNDGGLGSTNPSLETRKK